MSRRLCGPRCCTPGLLPAFTCLAPAAAVTKRRCPLRRIDVTAPHRMQRTFWRTATRTTRRTSASESSRSVGRTLTACWRSQPLPSRRPSLSTSCAAARPRRCEPARTLACVVAMCHAALHAGEHTCSHTRRNMGGWPCSLLRWLVRECSHLPSFSMRTPHRGPSGRQCCLCA